MLAERFGADNGRIARIILTSTVLSFVTFTSLATWFSAVSVDVSGLPARDRESASRSDRCCREGVVRKRGRFEDG